jgi:membrane protein DedA with SNARE-associated domain
MDALTMIHGPMALGLLALATLLHELGVPLPITPIALFLAARGVEDRVDLVVFTTAMVLATLAANYFWFDAGRRHGAEVFQRVGRFSLALESHVTRAERDFERWGSLTLLFGHFLPGVTVLAPPLAGAFGMSPSKFVALTSIGAVLYGLPLLLAGVLLRGEIDGVLATLDRIHSHIVVALAVAVAGYVVWRWRRRRAARAAVARG